MLLVARPVLAQVQVPDVPQLPKPRTAAPAPSSRPSASVERAFRDCAVDCPEMVVIPAGSFTMGPPASQDGRSDDEGPLHRVTIGRSLAVGRTPVTFAQWDACVSGGGCGGYRPADQSWGREDRPVINVSWNDAQAYVQWLAGRTGHNYRLLSEAEWEYAARGGTTAVYWWGDAVGQGNANCVYCGSQWGGRQTAPVGSFRSNPFGLQDMLGNVWQLTGDCYHSSYTGAPRHGSIWATSECAAYVQPGGSWYSDPRDIRSAKRAHDARSVRDVAVGLRVARTLGP